MGQVVEREERSMTIGLFLPSERAISTHASQNTRAVRLFGDLYAHRLKCLRFSAV